MPLGGMGVRYPGCINDAACNYDSLAGCDNGTCTFPGCTDTLALNFDELAGCDDGSCTYPPPCDSLLITFEQRPCVYLPNSNVLSAVIDISLSHTGDCSIASVSGIAQYPTDTVDAYHYTVYVSDDEALAVQFMLNDSSMSGEFEFTATSCDEDPTLCDCNGNSFGLGVLSWLGDGFADTSIGVWQGQLVNFNCALWGYARGDIAGAPDDDPNGVCDGGLPPATDSTGTSAYGCPVEVIELLKEQSFLVYPNPTRGRLNILCMGAYENRLLRIYDQTGHLVFTERRSMSPGVSEILDLGFLPSGTYHVQLIGSKEVQNATVVLQR
ncbi:MAG: T9SS type A sorting domain-containing protein [Flavobacteriales bacterium]